MGIDAAHMKENDVLFFYQLLLLMCSAIKSGIRKDLWKYCDSEIEQWSNIYSDHIGLGGAYSNKFEHIGINELVRWDGDLIRNGLRGG